MPSSVLRYTWEEVNREGREYSLELDVSVDWSPIIPAKIYGDPEDCHPAEGGDIDVTKVDLQKVEEILPTGERLGISNDGKDRVLRTYWEGCFRREVQDTDAFRDWLCEMVGHEETGPDPDDRRDELREREL